TDLLVGHFGKKRPVADLQPDDFTGLRKKMAKRLGPYRLGNTIQSIRSVFKYGYESSLIPVPVRFGPGFKKPNKKTIRLHRAAGGPKLFTAEEIRHMVDTAGTPLKAMILLGINCGFGNSDCGNLPAFALDLENGWVYFRRPKTGVNRRAALWAETRDAIAEALKCRPNAKDVSDAGLVFITQRGYSWAKEVADSPVTKETRK